MHDLQAIRLMRHAVVIDKVPLPTQTDDPQDAAHRALSWSQHRTQQQQLGVTPRALLHKQAKC
jgi:hypothetical protein